MKKLLFLIPILLVGACMSEPAADQSDNQVGAEQLEANKQLVLDMWHDVINGRNIEAASKYISEDYVQHSPSAQNGVKALVEFLKTEFPDSKPLEPGTFPLTDFEFVMAEGDLVQLMFQREVPDPHNPETMLKIWWYDTYRVKDGMIVEHWDSVVE